MYNYKELAAALIDKDIDMEELAAAVEEAKRDQLEAELHEDAIEDCRECILEDFIEYFSILFDEDLDDKAQARIKKEFEPIFLLIEREARRLG